MVATASTSYACGMAADLARTLARNFARLRKQVGTQEVFCERTGMSQAAVSEIENGKTFRSVQRLAEHLDAVGLDPMELLVRARTEEEEELLSLFESTDETTRRAILHIVRATAAKAHAARR